MNKKCQKEKKKPFYELTWWENRQGHWMRKRKIIDYIPETDEALVIELNKDADLDPKDKGVHRL